MTGRVFVGYELKWSTLLALKRVQKLFDVLWNSDTQQDKVFELHADRAHIGPHSLQSEDHTTESSPGGVRSFRSGLATTSLDKFPENWLECIVARRCSVRALHRSRTICERTVKRFRSHCESSSVVWLTNSSVNGLASFVGGFSVGTDDHLMTSVSS